MLKDRLTAIKINKNLRMTVKYSLILQLCSNHVTTESCIGDYMDNQCSETTLILG